MPKRSENTSEGARDDHDREARPQTRGKVFFSTIVDEVLTLKDGTMAPLDYKYTPYREHAFKTHQIQVTLYGLLVREIYKQPVTRGYAVYMRGGSKVLEIPLTQDIEDKALCAVAEIFEIMEMGRMPRRTSYRTRCGDCCYKNICV